MGNTDKIADGATELKATVGTTEVAINDTKTEGEAETEGDGEEDCITVGRIVGEQLLGVHVSGVDVGYRDVVGTILLVGNADPDGRAVNVGFGETEGTLEGDRLGLLLGITVVCAVVGNVAVCDGCKVLEDITGRSVGKPARTLGNTDGAAKSRVVVEARVGWRDGPLDTTGSKEVVNIRTLSFPESTTNISRVSSFIKIPIGVFRALRAAIKPSPDNCGYPAPAIA